MGDLTLNIARWEIACKCGCGYDTIDFKVVQYWQDACNYFKAQRFAERVRLTLTSGCRCFKHNEAEGGSKNSAHLYAKAIDGIIEVRVMGQWYTIPTNELAKYFDDRCPDDCGIGKYPSGRVHFDSRDDKRRRWMV